MSVIIRKINPKDNPHIERIIKSVFIEFKLPLSGTAYEDVETTQMFESYQQNGNVYYVIKENEVILGGGGIKALKDNNDNICELQKMYFDPNARGKGYGQLLIEKCLQFAKENGFEKCYLETLPNLEAAIHLYKKNGFTFLDCSLGNTGHSSCDVWMIKDL